MADELLSSRLGYADKGINQIVEHFQSEQVAKENTKKREQEVAEEEKRENGEMSLLPPEDIRTRVFLRYKEK